MSLRTFELKPHPLIPTLFKPKFVVMDAGEGIEQEPLAGKVYEIPVFDSLLAANLYIALDEVVETLIDSPVIDLIKRFDDIYGCALAGKPSSEILAAFWEWCE